jgi:hypothetical protein
MAGAAAHPRGRVFPHAVCVDKHRLVRRHRRC